MRRRSVEKLTWKDASPPKRLSMCSNAPDSYGIYELGIKTKNGFTPRYLGSAADQTLRKRLKQHLRKSHNHHIEQAKNRVWFRCIKTKTGEEALYLEGHYIAAYGEDYRWNKRNEWSQLFILDDVRGSH